MPNEFRSEDFFHRKELVDNISEKHGYNKETIRRLYNHIFEEIAEILATDLNAKFVVHEFGQFRKRYIDYTKHGFGPDEGGRFSVKFKPADGLDEMINNELVEQLEEYQNGELEIR